MSSAEPAPIAAVNAMPADQLSAQLRSCCGAGRWIEGMLAQRPFASIDAMLDAADEIWRGLGDTDWLEAFSHHPRIGETRAATPQDERAREWSALEQRAMQDAGADVRATLVAANAAYERRFGYICIICAAGRAPEELLAITSARLANSPETELRVAAEEQRKITRLRLQKLLHP